MICRFILVCLVVGCSDDPDGLPDATVADATTADAKVSPEACGVSFPINDSRIVNSRRESNETRTDHHALLNNDDLVITSFLHNDQFNKDMLTPGEYTTRQVYVYVRDILDERWLLGVGGKITVRASQTVVLQNVKLQEYDFDTNVHVEDGCTGEIVLLTLQPDSL